ncbi:MAG: hypothetical protein WED34_20290 [Planctomycetales bacterium]
MNVLQQLASFIAIACIVFLNVAWYRAKFFLRARGYRVSYFTRHWDDVRNLRHLIATTNSRDELGKANSLLLQIYGGFAAFFLVALPIMIWIWLSNLPAGH